MGVECAKYSGFCFGVREAVSKLEAVADFGVYTYGDIIHNQFVISKYMERGVCSVEDVKEVPAGSTMVIRAHGAPRAVFEEAKKRGIIVIDGTCPYVSRIHRIVEEASGRGRKVVILGNREHPEVRGIVGWCDRAIVFGDIGEAQATSEPVTIVVQTTYDSLRWRRARIRIDDLFADAEVHGTICSATEQRQNAARELAQRVDLMVVVGDRRSSNSKELWKICGECTETIMVERADELADCKFSNKHRIGVIGGASTPDEIIGEVILKLDKERNSK